MLKDKIKKETNEALKEKNEVKLSTLRMLGSEIHNAQIDSKEELGDEEVIKIIQKEAKKRKDAIEAYEKAGALERLEQEKQELAILQEYLPEEMGDEEIKTIIQESISQLGAKGPEDMGKVMGVVMGKTKGRADGNKVSSLVRELLNK